MPVNPYLVVIDEDVMHGLREASRYLIDAECTRFNKFLLGKLALYALFNLIPFLFSWFAQGLFAALALLVRDACITAAVHLVCIAVARKYTARLNATVNTRTMMALLSYRFVSAPSDTDVKRLVRFVTPQRWVGSLCDVRELGDRAIVMARSACALWSTRELYRVLCKTT